MFFLDVFGVSHRNDSHLRVAGGGVDNVHMCEGFYDAIANVLFGWLF